MGQRGRSERHHPNRLLEGVAHLAVLRALPGLGDLLCAVPALRALRAALPRARVTLVGLDAARLLLERFPDDVDELAALPGWPGLPEATADPREITAFLHAAQEARFDLAVQMHGDGTLTNPLASLLGAARTAGFAVPGRPTPDGTWFAYPAHDHEIHRNLRLAAALGAPDRGDHLEFPLHGDDEREATRLRRGAGLEPGGYACVHPGAADARRRWPPEAFARVADEIAGHGVRVAVTGSAGEADLAARVAGATRHGAVDLSGRTSLGGLAALLSDAALLVCNDTGVSHLGAALGVPSVVVFTASDPLRWSPLDGDRHRRVVATPAGGGAGGDTPEGSLDEALARVRDQLARVAALSP